MIHSIFICVLMYMTRCTGVHAHVCTGLQRPKSLCQASSSVVLLFEGYVKLCIWRDASEWRYLWRSETSNWGPVEEQYKLLNAEPYLQPFHFIILRHSPCLNVEFIHWLEWLAREFQGSPRLYFPNKGVTDVHTQTLSVWVFTSSYSLGIYFTH